MWAVVCAREARERVLSDVPWAWAVLKLVGLVGLVGLVESLVGILLEWWILRAWGKSDKSFTNVL